MYTLFDNDYHYTDHCPQSIGDQTVHLGWRYKSPRVANRARQEYQEQGVRKSDGLTASTHKCTEARS